MLIVVCLSLMALSLPPCHCLHVQAKWQFCQKDASRYTVKACQSHGFVSMIEKPRVSRTPVPTCVYKPLLSPFPMERVFDDASTDTITSKGTLASTSTSPKSYVNTGTRRGEQKHTGTSAKMHKDIHGA